MGATWVLGCSSDNTEGQWDVYLGTNSKPAMI